MALFSSMARRLALTKFGQKALAQSDGLNILKQRPTTRVYGGLTLMALSYLTGLPTLAFLSYLSVEKSQPMIIAVGGPMVFVLVHIVFGIGVYLAGRRLRYGGAAMGDQAISEKIHLTEEIRTEK